MIRAAFLSNGATVTSSRALASQFQQHHNCLSIIREKFYYQHKQQRTHRNHLSTRANDRDSIQDDDISATSNTPDVIDYFERLGVKRTFSISPEQVKSTYKKLMTQYHPDLHHQQQTKVLPEDRNDDLEASDIIHAYQIVSDPHDRALHLLELNGYPLNETDKNLISPELLLTVMEIREEIEDAVASSSASLNDEDDSSNKELKRLYDENRHRIELTCKNLDIAFDDKNFELAKCLVAELQYWNRVEETIREKST